MTFGMITDPKVFINKGEVLGVGRPTRHCCRFQEHARLRTYTGSAPLRPTGFLSGWSVGLEFPAAASLRDPVIDGNNFRRSLKALSFVAYWCIQRIRGFTTMRYILRFTYFLTGTGPPKIWSECCRTICLR